LCTAEIKGYYRRTSKYLWKINTYFLSTSNGLRYWCYIYHWHGREGHQYQLPQITRPHSVRSFLPAIHDIIIYRYKL